MQIATAPPASRPVPDVHVSDEGVTWARVHGSVWVRGQSAYELLVRFDEVSRSLGVTA